MMRKFLCAAILLLSMVSFAFTQPDIHGVSGVVNNGETLILNGTSFGTKSTAAPLVYDDFEDGTLNTTLDTGTWSIISGLNGPGDLVYPEYSNGRTRQGSSVSARSICTDPVIRSAFGWTSESSSVDRIYMDVWVRNVWGVVTVTDWTMLKLGADNYNMELSSDCRIDGGELTTVNVNCFDEVLISAFGSGIGLNDWAHVQWYVEASTEGLLDGTVELWVDEVKLVDRVGDICTRDGGQGLYYEAWFSYLLNVAATKNCPIIDTSNTSYYDNAYIDNSRARIEIGDNEIYASCTHREIQIPSEWSDTDITFEFNAGSYEKTDQIFIFVVDSDGAAGKGYPAIIGSSDPYINTVTGTLNHGEEIILDGSNFMIKIPATPLRYDSFESGVHGSTLEGWNHSTNDGRPATYSNARTRTAGSSLSAYCDYTDDQYLSSFGVTTGAETFNTAYFDFWVYTEMDVVPTRNWKVTRLYPYGDWGSPNTYFSTSCSPTGGRLATDGLDSGGLIWTDAWGVESAEGVWKHVQIFIEASSLGVEDGIAEVWIDGSKIIDSSTYKTHESNSLRWTGAWLGNYIAHDGIPACPASGDHSLWMEDAYVDTSRARVEIGNNADYESCTHREIQYPKVWTNNSITIDFNAGAFVEDDVVYFFVVSEDGATNVGKQATIGSTPSGDPVSAPDDVTFGNVSVRFLVMADQVGYTTELVDALDWTAARLPEPDFVMFLGDTYMSTQNTSVNTAYGKDMQWYNALGNHCIECAWNEALSCYIAGPDSANSLAIQAEFAANAAYITDSALTNHHGTIYSIDYGNFHGVFLNTTYGWMGDPSILWEYGNIKAGNEYDIISEQMDWFYSDVQGSSADQIVVFVHNNLFGNPGDMDSGEIRYSSSGLPVAQRDSIKTLIVDEGVSMYMHGHTHTAWEWIDGTGVYTFDPGHTRGDYNDSGDVISLSGFAYFTVYEDGRMKMDLYRQEYDTWGGFGLPYTFPVGYYNYIHRLSRFFPSRN